MPRLGFLLSLTLAVVLAASAARAADTERINNYHADIEVLQDGSLKVTETITVTAEQRKIKRVHTIAAIYVVAGVAIGAAVYLLADTAIAQFKHLIGWLRQPDNIILALLPTTSAPTEGGSDLSVLIEFAKEQGSAIAQRALAWTAAIYENLMFWITAALLFPVCLFYFLWNYDHIIEVARAHLPEDTRDVVVKIVCTIDRSMAEFFRGRLIICAAVGALTALGWVACPGVANGLPFGILVGVLNLVPFLAFLGLPPVLILTYVERTGASEDWIMPIVLALAVFLAVQAIENFALSPYVMAQSSGLHPVTAVIVLLIGGQIAGVLGMLLAVPIASTLKTLGAEFVMPEVRRLAGIDEKPLFEGPLALKDAEPDPSDETDSSSDA